MNMHKNEKIRNSGFTLLEVMIAIAIAMVILLVLGTTFLSQRRIYDVQEQVNEMVQETRAAIDTMKRDIRMAGYDPTGVGFNGISFGPNQINVFADINSDGDTADLNEAITYTYDSVNMQINRNTGSGNQLLADHIQSFSFTYLDDNMNPTTIPADIRQVRIMIMARTEKPDPEYPNNGGYRTYTLTSATTPINLK